MSRNNQHRTFGAVVAAILCLLFGFAAPISARLVKPFVTGTDHKGARPKNGVGESSRSAGVWRVPHIVTLDGTMNNPDLLSPSICEAACFAATYSFSTVPYYSLDQPRNITLVYNGDQASPRPFLFVDVDTDDGTGVAVDSVRMTATVNGSAVTFVTGSTAISYPAVLGPVRLIGQFDASGLATNIYPSVITVRAFYADGTTAQKTLSTQVMVLNEAGAPVAKGWTVAGIQRLYSAVGSGYLITGGDGSGVRFTGLGVKAADFTQITYDAASTTYTRTYPDGSRVIFNSTGQQASYIDPFGVATSFTYDGSGRIQGIGDPYRKQPNAAATYISLTYDGNGLRTIQEPGPDGTPGMGRTTSFLVNSSRCLLSAQDPGGGLTAFSCDGNGRLATITDRRGGVTVIGYDPVSWKLSQVTLPQIPIDAGGGGTTLVNPVLHYGAWQFTGAASVGNPSGYVQDAAGRTTSFAVNRYGQAVDITDAGGRRTQIATSGFLPITVTHHDGTVDSFGYDSFGRDTMSKPAGEDATYFRRGGPNSQIDSVYGPGARPAGRRYNANNQLSHIDYYGARYDYLDLTYDPATKRIASRQNAAFHRVTYTYDPKFGNLNSVGLAGGRATTKTFDAVGRDSTKSATGAATSTTQYDLLNRITRIYDGVNANPLIYSYDSLFLTGFQDANGNSYHSSPNALGWSTSQCDPLSACVSYRYNKAGDVTSLTNRRGQLLTMTVDNLGRVTSKVGTNTNNDYFSYSTDDRILVAWNGFERDSLFVNPGLGTGPVTDSIVTWIDGRRFRVFHGGHKGTAGIDSTSISSNGSVVFNTRRFTYGTDGRLQSIEFGMGATTLAYNTEGVLSEIDYPGVQPTQLNNTSLQLPRQKYYNAAPLGAVFGRDPHYDATARIDQSGMSGGSGTLSAFGYDLLGRLAGRDTKSSCTQTSTDQFNADGSGIGYSCSTLVASDTFSYDAMGNRTDNGALPSTGNRYTTFGGSALSYDLDGNVIQKNNLASYNRQYLWSAENQLIRVTRVGVDSVRYDYNALGKPVRKLIGGSNGVVDSYYLWDGDNIIAELDASGARRTDYVYLPGTGDQPFAQMLGGSSPTNVRYHQQDALGNILGTMESGIPSQTVTYNSWGLPTVQGNTDNALLWKGLLWAPDPVNLYYMRNRWYDPELGRFMSEDPIGHEGGSNLYAFSHNDPVNGQDPTGLCDVDIATWIDFTLNSPGQGTYSHNCTELPTVWIWAYDPTPDPPSLNPLFRIGQQLAPFNRLAESPWTQFVVFGLISGEAGELGELPNAARNLRNTADQSALVRIAKDAFRRRGGWTREEWEVLKGWAKEYEIPFRGPEVSVRGLFKTLEHVHLGPLEHIPIL